MQVKTLPNDEPGRRWAILGTALLIAALGVGAGCGGRRSDDAPTATVAPGAMTEISTSGKYEVTLTPQIDPIAINQLHTWTVHIDTVNGEPLDDAILSIDGDMPAHGHGLPTDPQVTQALGDGTYLIEGMKFQMGGDWVLDLTIEANGEHDQAHFAFTIPE